MKLLLKSDHEFEILEFQLVRKCEGDDQEAEDPGGSGANNTNNDKIVARVRVNTVVLMSLAQLALVVIGAAGHHP